MVKMQTLKELITACHVENPCSQTAQDLEETWRLYDGTGFESKARELKPKLLFAEAHQKLSNPIMFKRPNFTVSLNSFPRYPLKTPNSIKLSRDVPWVYEVEPRFFKGNVPGTILTTALEAKKLGFKLYVWFVSSAAELQNFLDQPVVKADPALVAYPIVAKEAGEDVIDDEFGIVLGLWGKDIEQISSAVEQENYHIEPA